jgi:ATP-dependent protease ClpP protease subunit
LTDTSKAPYVHLFRDGTIKYRGYINFAGYQLLQKEYADAASKGIQTTLRIKSKGGDPYAGMMMGRFIKEKKMRLKVRDYCLSACANYLFPAATNKLIEKDAIVGFHQSQSGMRIDGERIPVDEVIAVLDKTGLEILIKDKHVNKDKTTDKKTDSTKITQSAIAMKRSQYYPEYLARCGKKKSDIGNSPTESEVLQLIKNKLTSCFNYLDEQQIVFYKELDVDFRLPDIGIAKLKQAQIKSDRAIKFFYYDPASLKALRIKNVNYEKDWDPKDNHFYKKMIEVSMNDWQQ